MYDNGYSRIYRIVWIVALVFLFLTLLASLCRVCCGSKLSAHRGDLR